MSRPRKKIRKALKRKGFIEEQGKRDHDFYFFEHEGEVTAVFTKMSRGTKYKEIGTPLLKRMSKQLRLSSSEFDDLIDCPMSKSEYVEVLVALGVLR